MQPKESNIDFINDDNIGDFVSVYVAQILRDVGLCRLFSVTVNDFGHLNCAVKVIDHDSPTFDFQNNKNISLL